jgi:O-antigen ligase
MMTFSEKVLNAFLFITPFIYASNLIDPVLVPREFALCAYLFISTIIILKNSRTGLEVTQFKTSISFLTFLLLIAYVISHSQSLIPSESIFTISRVLLLVILFINIGLQLKYKLVQLNKLWIGFILMVISVQSLAIYQVFETINTYGKLSGHLDLIKSTYANKNLLSIFLFLTLPFVLFLSSNKRQKHLSYAIATISFLLMSLLKTRSVLIGWGLAFTLYFILYFIYAKSDSIKKKVYYLGISLAISLTSYLIAISIQNIKISTKYNFENVISANTELLSNKHTLETRLKIWKSTSLLIKENFWLGIGPGNWQFNLSKYGLNQFDVPEIRNGITTFQRPHNDFLWIFSETGFVGILSYILIYVVTIYSIIKLLRNEKDDIKKQQILMAFLSAMFGFSIIQFFDFPLERTELMMIFFIVISYINFEHNKNQKVSSKISINYIYINLFSLALIFLIISRRLNGEFHTHKMIEYHHKNEWTSMIKEANLAESYFYKVDPTSIPLNWYKGVAYFTTANPTEAFQEFSTAIKMSPYNIHILNNLASTYESKGEHDSAICYYNKALAISPNFEESLLNLSAVYYNQNNIEKAFQTIKQVNYKSANPKYLNSYLPAILTSWCKNFSSLNPNNIQLNELNNNSNKLIELFMESQKHNTSFESHIINYKNEN